MDLNDDNSTPLSIIFAGTPDFAAKHLEALYASHHEVVAVYTQPDRPAGRGKKLTPSAVKVLAIEHGTAIYQPESLKSAEAQKQFQQLNADVMVVVAYGIILPIEILKAPKYGCLNVHGSLLPRWRGAAPIQRAIWAGDEFTGVSIMQMDEGLDTGDVLLEKSIAIAPIATSASLYDDLADLGPPALLETLDNLLDLEPIKQDDELANYAKKLSKEEAQIDWSLDAEQLSRNVRAFNPWPIAWFEHNDTVVKVWQAEIVEAVHEEPPGQVISFSKAGLEISTAKHNLNITMIQLPGKKPSTIANIINGKPDLFLAGDKL